MNQDARPGKPKLLIRATNLRLLTQALGGHQALCKGQPVPKFRDADRLAHCQLQRIGPPTLAAALALLRQLAEVEQAPLPRGFYPRSPSHAALCAYLTQPPAGHWHLGLQSTAASDLPTREALLGLVSGFMIPDPQAAPSQSAPPRAAFFINSLIIARHLRGYGYGAFCLETLARLARARGAQRLYVALSHDNPVALPFYRRQHFQPSPLLYWSLTRKALLRAEQQLGQAPLILHRIQTGSQPGLLRLMPPGQELEHQPGPPLDLGFGFDYGIEAWEAWLAPSALSDPKAWGGQVYALTLRQLQAWLGRQSPSTAATPRFGLTGLAPRLPEGGELAEARVLQRDLI